MSSNLYFNGNRYPETQYQTLSKKVFSTSQCSNTFLTIVVPTFDRIELLEESLSSIENQEDVNYPFEVIVICDNPNNTEVIELVQTFKIDSLSLYINRQNIGLFETLNLGVRLAQSEWVSFLHDDDRLKSDYLKKIMVLMNRRKDIGAIMVTPQQFGNVTYRSSFRQSKLYSILKPIKDHRSVGKYYPLRLIDTILWCADQYGAPSCGSVWNKEKFLSLGGYDDRSYPSGDWFFMVKFNERYKVYKTTEQLGYYRWSDNASTKPEIIRKFITDNLSLREYFKERYVLGKIVYYLTKNVHYKHIIDVFIGFDKTHTLKPHDFDDVYPYPKNSIYYFIYLYGQRAYWILRVMISLVFG